MVATSGAPLSLPIRAPLSAVGDDNANDDGVSHSSDDDSASFVSGDDEFDASHRRNFFGKPLLESLDMDSTMARLVGQEEDGGIVPSPAARVAGSSFPGGYGASRRMVPIARVSEEVEDEDDEGEEGVQGDGEDEGNGGRSAPDEPGGEESARTPVKEMGTVDGGNSGFEKEGVGVSDGGEKLHIGSGPTGETVGSDGSVEAVENGQKREAFHSVEFDAPRSEETGSMEVVKEHVKPESAANEVAGDAEQGDIGGEGLLKGQENPETRVVEEASGSQDDIRLLYSAIEPDNGAEMGAERPSSHAPDSKEAPVLDVEKTSVFEGGSAEVLELEGISVGADKSGGLSGDSGKKTDLQPESSVNGEAAEPVVCAGVVEGKDNSLEGLEKSSTADGECAEKPEVRSEPDSKPSESSGNSTVEIEVIDKSAVSNVEFTGSGDAEEAQNGDTSLLAASVTSRDLGTESVPVVEAPEGVAIGSFSSPNEVEDKTFVEFKTSFPLAVEGNKDLQGAADHPKLESVPGPARDIIDYIEEYENSSHDEDGTDAIDVDSEYIIQEEPMNFRTGSEVLKDTDAPVILSADLSNSSQLHDGGAAASIDESKKLSFVEELEKFINASGSSGVRIADGQPAMSDSDEAVDTEDDDGEEDKVLFDSAALTALLKAASSASTENSNAGGTQNTAGFFSGKGPAGLGSSIPSLRPSAPRSTRPSIFTPDFSASRESETETMDEEEKKLNEKINSIRVKFLRLVHRLGHSSEETVAAQVLYRLGLAEGMRRGRAGSRVFSVDAARQTARKLEEEGKGDLDFSCTILVIGKSGVGKSATINSIFGEERAQTNAFEPATSAVKEITGVVDGVNIRLIDSPGLKASVMEQAANRKILSSVKQYMKKFPPDIVLYVDRMDTRSRDTNDLPLLRSITSYLGASIWFNAIVALTHASSAPPDGPNGTALGYDTSIAHRSHAVQQSIRQAAGDMRLMNPVALVENHSSCRRNRDGNQVLPNGQTWRPQLLLLCYSTKILSEANSLLKMQDPAAGKLFLGGLRYRSAPLPYLLSSLLQARAHPKVASADQGDDDLDLEEELSDADADEEGDEYDQLPPFRPLRKSQLAKLSKEQRKAYFDEYDYRVKLLQKKQLKEELRRRREARKQSGSGAANEPEEFDPESGGPAAVPVPLPDMVLPPSFDGDNPAYRYRFLEPTGSQLLARPVLDNHGWDHDCGYDGVSLEENLAIAGRFPAGLSVQVTKDKKEFNIHMDSSVSVKHGENGSTLAGFDVQTVGKQLAYIFRGESKFKNFKKNKTAAGLSFTLIGETIATGIKLEDQITIGKRANLAASAGAIRAQSDVAYGANLEARIMEKDYPIGQDATTLGLSLMRWRGDLALGANLQSQFSVGRGTKTAVRVGLNNKFTGQITVRTSSSEQLQIALMGILPLAVTIYRSIRPGDSHFMH
ncbi:unnamed protein product [Victoria cruziana]